MSNKFKYSPLAIMIASALSLAGCGSGSDSTVSGDMDNDTTIPVSEIVDTDKEMASVKLAVKFPQADASAAWIGDTKSIEVSFFSTQTIGSIDEANDTYNSRCLEEIDWQSHCNGATSDVLRGQFATSVTMDTQVSSASVDLLPGKYRIEAKFSNAQGYHQETSVSYVTLSKGEHNLKLRGLEATWTAAAQLNLQLLNQASDFDWDPETDGIQTAAQKIGITGAITGLHLPTVLTYPDGYLRAENGYEGQAFNKAALINAGVTNIEQLDRESQGTAFQPVLRIADATNGEYNLFPRFLSQGGENQNEDGEFTGASGSWNTTGVAVLQQDYSSEGESANLHLGGYYMGYWDYDGQENLDTNHSVSLEFGTSSLPDAEQDEAAYSIIYSSEQYGQNEGEMLTIARINFDGISDNSDVDNNWQQLFIDLQGAPNQIVDGSTITGFLIETETHYTRVESNEWNNSGTDITPTSFLGAAMVKLAQNEGLMVSAAADNTCSTQAISGLEYSNDYRWDETQQGWIAGTFNGFLAENGLLANIEMQITSQTEQLDTAQQNLDIAQAELDIYDTQLIAIVETKMADVTSVISEIETIATDNSDLITDYNLAVSEADNASITYDEKREIYQGIDDQISLYDAGMLPDCDSACYDLLVQDRTAAQSDYNAAWDVYWPLREQKDLLYINYQVIEQQVNDLIAPYNIYTWGEELFEVANSELQIVSNNLQTTLEEITSNSDISNYYDEWELINNRQNALWPLNDALSQTAEANDRLAKLGQIKVDALATADLNGDGEATLFEEGVYLASGSLSGWVNWDYSWDEETGQESLSYYLELNEFVIKETVKASSMEGEQTICVQPFELKASPLSLEFDTDAGVIIE